MSKRDFAIVIGIDKYRGLRQLSGAIADAREVYEVLHQIGVPKKNMKLVLGREPPFGKSLGWRPRISEIDDAFDAIFERAEGKRPRRLYVYFAGHGCGMERLHVNLLLADARRDFLAGGVNAQAYEKVLARMTLFPEQVFFYDCCRTYDGRAEGRGPSFMGPAKPDKRAGEIIQLVHYGTLWQRRTYERPIDESEDVRGLFTTALCEGLRGWAAERRGGDWVVSAASLRAYTERRVKQLADLLNVREQRPDFDPRPPGEGPILVTGVQPQTIEATVEVRLPEQERILVNDRPENRAMTAAIEDGTASLPLVPGAYTVTALPSGQQVAATVEPDKENRFVIGAQP